MLAVLVLVSLVSTVRFNSKEESTLRSVYIEGYSYPRSNIIPISKHHSLPPFKPLDSREVKNVMCTWEVTHIQEVILFQSKAPQQFPTLPNRFPHYSLYLGRVA